MQSCFIQIDDKNFKENKIIKMSLSFFCILKWRRWNRSLEMKRHIKAIGMLTIEQVCAQAFLWSIFPL